MTHAVVLTAEAGVSDAAAVAVASALEQAGARILSERRLGPAGYEIGMDRAVGPPVLEGCDINLVRMEGREKRLLIADMDSTMIPVECIDELADFAGVKDRVSAITEAAMAGEFDFEGALRARVALLEGLGEDVLQRCYDERISLNPGARALVRTMAERGAVTALVSGGFTFFTSRVAREAGFHHNQANTLLFEGSVLTGTVGEPILGREAKRTALEHFCAEGGFGPDDVVAVGDGANDLAMVEAAGLGVAYRAKAALRAKADAVLDHSDLTAILHLQGIPEADFVTG
ncbi:MAG: phosphoserine phosphatase SerB [Rubricella sp.]